MVSNEKNPRGDSIAERYGRPVTASDVEDLLYHEHVPSGTISKVMQAVRQALSWQSVRTVRPWAGDLEDGLTRQEDRRRDARREREAQDALQAGQEGPSEARATPVQLFSPEPRVVPSKAPLRAAQPDPEAEAQERRARLADELRMSGRLRAAAGFPESQTVNTPDAADALPQDPSSRAGEAPESVANPVPRPITPERVPEAPEGLSGTVSAEEANAVQDALAITMTEAQETLDDVFADLRAAVAATGGLGDAPGEPAQPPAAVAAPAPRVTAPPARREAYRGLAAVPSPVEDGEAKKTCSQCGSEWSRNFFQRDKRSTDGRRPECKKCSAERDAVKRSLRKTTESGGIIMHSLAAVPDPVMSDPEAQALRERITEALASEPSIIVLPQEVPDDGLRQCARCRMLKNVEEDFYVRRDGKKRYVCIECEREDSRKRRLRRKWR